jgi:N-carbamoylputrescine amidase
MTTQPYSYEPKTLVESYECMKTENGWWTSKVTDTDEQNSSPTVTASTATTTSDGKTIIAAAVQLCGTNLPNSDITGYCQRAEQAIIDAATIHQANLILLPELWAGPYFCQTIHNDLFRLADTIFDTNGNVHNILIERMQYLAKLYHVVLPVSIYECCNNVYYNTVVMIDHDGTIVGIPYRKSHIPDAIGYQEKFYFTPGDTGFQVYPTAVGMIGVGICWDQWFPEVARSLVLMGAEILVYPTAIGNEPEMPDWDTSDHWQRVMQGHSGANFVPVIAANRYGTEILYNNDTVTERQRMTFYGKSFITDCTGQKLVEVDNSTMDMSTCGYVIITAPINIVYNQNQRRIFGCFRDRRPDLYHTILTKDGRTKN